MNLNRSALDLWVGAFVAIGIAAIIFLALKVGNLIDFGSTPGYRLEARFDNIGRPAFAGRGVHDAEVPQSVSAGAQAAAGRDGASSS